MSRYLAGLEFVTLIDDIMFALAKRGYFTSAVKKACDTVSENVVPRYVLVYTWVEDSLSLSSI